MLVLLTIVTEVQTPYTVHVCSCTQNSLSIYVQYIQYFAWKAV